MKISTKGRYALRVMVDLARHYPGDKVPLLDIAQRQDISEKYLESIVASLSKAGLVDATRGKGGGYRLIKDPRDYTVMEILRSSEGSIAPVACLDDDGDGCERMDSCPTLPMWKQLYEVIENYFNGVTLEDLANGKIEF
ncbi:MAG: RrF2 family transcriptional regulator [Oscillospiraceae bacterium]|nr:RrF2 family transcriptional regulator [Oscillospiraceae bacterium]